MHGSFFLSPHCMTRSLHSSWVDRHMQLQRDSATDRCNTMVAMLSAFICDSYRRLLSRHFLIGNPPPKDVFSAMFMAMMYPDAVEEGDNVIQCAQSIIRHYAKLYPDDFVEFREEFNRVKAANLSADSFTAQDTADLRHSIREAVENMVSS